MALVVNFILQLNAAVVTAVISDGYFVSGTYSNPYPFPLSLQLVDLSPPKGDKFFYNYTLEPFTTDVPIPMNRHINVNEMFGKIMFARG